MRIFKAGAQLAHQRGDAGASPAYTTISAPTLVLHDDEGNPAQAGMMQYRSKR